MKRIAIRLLCLLLLNLNDSFTVSAQENCDQVLARLTAFYEKNYMVDKMYIKLTIQTIEEGNKKGEKLLVEMWKDKDKMKYQNPFLTSFKDANTQVMVVKDKKLIIVKDVKNTNAGKELLNNMMTMTSPDSLRKITSSIICSNENGQGHLILQFPKMHNKKYNVYKKVDLYFIEKSGELKRSEYEYYGEGNKREVYEYLAYSHQFSDKELEGTALSNVMTKNNLLLKPYSGYSIKNLQAKK